MTQLDNSQSERPQLTLLECIVISVVLVLDAFLCIPAPDSEPPERAYRGFPWPAFILALVGGLSILVTAGRRRARWAWIAVLLTAATMAIATCKTMYL